MLSRITETRWKINSKKNWRLKPNKNSGDHKIPLANNVWLTDVWPMNVSGMDGWKPRWMNRRTDGRTNDAVDDCYVLYIRLAFKGDRHIKQQSQLYHRYAEGRTDGLTVGRTDRLAGKSRKLSTLKCSVTRRRSRHRCRISKNRTFLTVWEIFSHTVGKFDHRTPVLLVEVLKVVVLF